MVQLAFEQAVKALDAHVKEGKSLEWASYKATYVGHLLQALPAFSRVDLPVGGNGNIVNAMKKNHGPSWRMIVELGSETKALAPTPAGNLETPEASITTTYSTPGQRANTTPCSTSSL